MTNPVKSVLGRARENKAPSGTRRAHAVPRPALAIALAALLASGGAMAQEKKPEAAPVPAWQSILALQLSSAHKCDLDKVLFFHEVPVGETVSTEGRARCLDGREYDFSRERAHEKFTLRLCQPTVC
ncbi:MAG: hypothetical protein JNM89_08435 [Hyphomicrobiaceae bacterium]|nr:hypothetical protein [Hyphomicrobiaceae bacterium]